MSARCSKRAGVLATVRKNCRTYFALGALTLATINAAAQPAVDHHQHLFSRSSADLSPGTRAITAGDLVALLDAAGIERALVLSVAYQFGNPNRPPVADEYEKVRAENDWTSQQVARFPARLRGFCGFNPLRDYALAEIGRCAGDAQLRFGIKLHFGNSDVDLDDPAAVRKVREVFRSANDHGMAIAVHLRPSVTLRRPYGAKEARVFVDEVLSAAPNVPVQIAHLGGAGGFDDSTDEALSVFVEAIAKLDPVVANVFFDVSGVAGIGEWSPRRALRVATRIRQLGLDRILYGSDAAVATNTPREAWEKFKTVPLSASELGTIERNIAPYMR